MKFKKIFLIDDSEIDNYVNKHIITKSGIAEMILTMTSAEDALQYLIASSETNIPFPELIFLDIRMPAMNGFEFLDVFEKFPSQILSACKIIMLTSSLDQRDIERAKNYPHVAGYLNKPLNTDSLNNVLVPIHIFPLQEFRKMA